MPAMSNDVTSAILNQFLKLLLHYVSVTMWDIRVDNAMIKQCVSQVTYSVDKHSFHGQTNQFVDWLIQSLPRMYSVKIIYSVQDEVIDL